MSFIATVSGSAADPNSVPEMMQRVIKDINVKTMAELLQAITSNWLTTAWTVDGGWQKWLYVIIKEVTEIMRRFFMLPPFTDSFYSRNVEERLVEYFRSLGYDSEEASSMASKISIALKE